MGAFAPSEADLGIETRKGDTRDWPLHVKDTGSVNWDVIKEHVKGTALEFEVNRAREWVSTDRYYGLPANSCYKADEIPVSSFTVAQVDTMLEKGKLEKYSADRHGAIRSYALGFTVAETQKRRLRPIFEPRLNTCAKKEGMTQLRYPSRKERRAEMREAEAAVTMDFAAFFDQIELDVSVRACFVVRVATATGHELYVLTKLPMGATFAPFVAQVITWALLVKVPVSVSPSTMIDNVRLAARNKGVLMPPLREYLQVLKSAGITLNDAQLWDAVREGGDVSTTPDFVFLGEQYAKGTIANTSTNVEKLAKVLVRMREPHYTKRHFASMIGLITSLGI
jgi:hypothetical protein